MVGPKFRMKKSDGPAKFRLKKSDGLKIRMKTSDNRKSENFPQFRIKLSENKKSDKDGPSGYLNGISAYAFSLHAGKGAILTTFKACPTQAVSSELSKQLGKYIFLSIKFDFTNIFFTL